MKNTFLSFLVLQTFFLSGKLAHGAYPMIDPRDPSYQCTSNAIISSSCITFAPITTAWSSMYQASQLRKEIVFSNAAQGALSINRANSQEEIEAIMQSDSNLNIAISLLQENGFTGSVFEAAQLILFLDSSNESSKK